MNRTLAIALTLCSLTCAVVPVYSKGASKDAGNPGIIYGKDFAIILAPPAGWSMNVGGGSSQRVNAAFYPKGSSFAKATTVMYATVNGKRKGSDATLAAFIRGDITDLKRDSPNLRVTDAPKLPTAGKPKATVKHFSGDANGNWEAVAYIDEKSSVVVLALTSRDKPHFTAALPAFRRLVSSYLWVTDKVQIGLPTGAAKKALRPKAPPRKSK